jgi:NAD(P)-dependent dehydrogenase (short-subunit alcohol dehydrogenase family)
MSEKLSGKVAIVTGGSRGIGSGICKELALAGARVALNYTSNEIEALKVAAEIEAFGGEVRIYQTDVGNKVQVDAMIAQVIADYGQIDILVNNAGICPFKDFFDITEETWNRTIQVNLTGMFFTSQAVGHYMKEHGGGSIINISTVTALRGGSMQVHYAASKGGVNSLTSAMSNAVKKYGIRVNAILCGGVPTDINDEQRKGIKPMVQQAESKPEKQFAINNWGSPEDLGKAVVFLASDDSQWVTGSMMAVDGGALVS